MEVASLGEGVMAPRPIDGDAEDRGAILLELRQRLVIESHLIAADRAPVGRVERKHNRFAGEIAERERLIGSDVQREVRRFRAGREQLRLLP